MTFSSAADPHFTYTASSNSPLGAPDPYRTLVYQLPQPCCLGQVLFDASGAVVDFQFLAANTAYHQHTGQVGLEGHTWRERLAEPLPAWHLVAAQVARTGEAAQWLPAEAGPSQHHDALQVLPAGPAGSHLVTLLWPAAPAPWPPEDTSRLFITTMADTIYRMSPDWQQMLALQGKGFLVDTPGPSEAWLARYIPPDDQVRVAAAVQAAVAAAQPFTLEHRVMRADGSVGWTFSRAVPVFDAAGRLCEWFGVANDITARKQAEAAQRELLTKYHKLFEAMAQGFGIAELLPATATTPTDVRWLEVNPAFTRLTGLSAEQLGRGVSVRRLGLHIEEEWFTRYERVLHTRQGERFELFVSRVGEWFDVYAFPLDETEPSHLGVLFYNSTARKQITQQQQLAAVLEGQEEERRRIAESLHNGLGQLLFATKLQLDQLPPRPTEPGRQRATDLLSEAVRQVRTISHTLAPALLADFGLKVALDTLCAQLTSPSLRWHCHVELAEGPALPLVLQQAVYRLVLALAHNVAQHAQASEATIEVDALPDGLVLRMEDNGRGFDPATVHHGLGLTTLQSYAAVLGGVVQLESAPELGTQILVRWPWP
jgi:signal transduction histidine kinase